MTRHAAGCAAFVLVCLLAAAAVAVQALWQRCAS